MSQQTADCFQGQEAVNPRYDSHYTAYGYTSQGRLGPNPSREAINNELDARFAQVCENMRTLPNPIEIYTITFDLDDEATQQQFRECATDESNYFNSPDAAALSAAFTAIGAELSNLRISQ